MTAQPITKILVKRKVINLSDLLNVEVQGDNKYLLTNQGILDLAKIILQLDKGKINGSYSRLDSLLSAVTEKDILLKNNYNVSIKKETYDLFRKVYPLSIGIEYNDSGILEISLSREEVLPLVRELFHLGGSLLEEIHTQSKQLGGK
jgi:hypothetical protein